MTNGGELPGRVGATFVRADLHVHTHADSDASPEPDLDAYIKTSMEHGIDVLAITDHNRVDFVRAAMKAAESTSLLVLPGIEISTHDGHLLAIFPPTAVTELEALAAPGNLQLTDLSETEKRSTRSILHLVEEIHKRGGLAIPAHVDVKNGAATKMSSAQLQELLKHPGLAGLEFADSDALASWFTDDDTDSGRLAAWHARQKVPELKARGLARLMSSDAHSPDQVGRDRKSRTLTRLRIDDPNFAAVKNAIVHNPKARCKAEVVLPASYPRLISAEFEGGFLDGVEMDFSENLNCLIGGRGSGKSTALLAIRAALGGRLGPEEDPDDEDRMPAVTRVTFIDTTGAEATAIRQRGEAPRDESGTPVRLRLADLGQEETGRLAQGYNANPALLLEFLDSFVHRDDYDETERALLEQLEENSSVVARSRGIAKQIEDKKAEEARLDARLKKANQDRVEEIARWAATLASQGPFLSELETQITNATRVPNQQLDLSIDELALQFGVDLAGKAAAPHIDGADGLRQQIGEFSQKRDEILAAANKQLAEAADTTRRALDKWIAEQQNLEKRLSVKQQELEEQGLKVQAGAVQQIGGQLQLVRTQLAELNKRHSEHSEALQTRKRLLEQLRANRRKLFFERKVALERIANEANRHTEDLTIRVWFEEAGSKTEWVSWLANMFSLRQRAFRLAEQVGPHDFAEKLQTDAGRQELLTLKDTDGSTFFAAEQLEAAGDPNEIFRLETMLLPDLARIQVQRKGDPEPHSFDHLSAGQQRSVLLSLLLCAERNEPLVLDQPEDHLDGQYIAESVVSHLEAAKERRQVIIATHSANLTVLGDAELVMPMVVEGGKGKPELSGAVDRPDTRKQVCSLLEGGVQAYQKRGKRYGLRFAEEDV